MCTGIDDSLPLDLVIAKTERNLPGAICTRGPCSHPVGSGRLVLGRVVECLESQTRKAVLEQQPGMSQHTVCSVWKLIAVLHHSYISNVVYLTLKFLMTQHGIFECCALGSLFLLEFILSLMPVFKISPFLRNVDM